MSTGGAGGSNREVVFRITVTKDASVDAVIGELEKRFANLQAAANLRVGATAGGMPGQGGYVQGGAPGGTAGRPGGTGGAGGRGGSAMPGGAPPTLAQDFNRLEREWAQWERKRQQEEKARDREEKRIHSDRLRRVNELRAGFGEALEGVTSLARGFVLLGVSGEENIERALRSLAKFEAVAQMARGSMKLANFAGKGLSLAAENAGLAAGAGAGGLGAAAVAAGVGVLGAGFAIGDTIRYNATGQIGAYSQGYAGAATSAARTLSGYGIRPGGYGNVAATVLSGGTSGAVTGLLEGGGFYGAADAQQRGERMAGNTIADMSGRIQVDMQRLNIEKEILATMQREAATVKEMSAAGRARKDSAAEIYAGMDPWQRGSAIALRKKFLADPNSLNDRQLAEVAPLLGEREQNKIQRIYRDRARKAGLYDEGWQKEEFAESQQQKWDDQGFMDGSGLRIDKSMMKREYVVKLETENTQQIEQLRTLLTDLYKHASEDFRVKLEKLEQEMNANFRRIEGQRQSGSNAQADALGGN